MAAQVFWLNGTFGVGKSSAARMLAATHADSYVFEPELIGHVLKRLPASPPRHHNYQHLRLWRLLTRWTLLLLSHAWRGVLIAPMTMVEPRPRTETIFALRRAGLMVHEVVLVASQDRVAARMRARGAPPDNWGLRQFTRCATHLEHILSQFHIASIDTDDLDLAATVDALAQLFP